MYNGRITPPSAAGTAAPDTVRLDDRDGGFTRGDDHDGSLSAANRAFFAFRYAVPEMHSSFWQGSGPFAQGTFAHGAPY